VTALGDVVASYQEGELGFLTFTGNIELNVRDRLAYALHRRGHFATREWRRAWRHPGLEKRTKPAVSQPLRVIRRQDGSPPVPTLEGARIVE